MSTAVSWVPRLRKMLRFRPPPPRMDVGEALLAAISTADDAVIGMNDGQRIVYWNDGAERTFGYTAREIIGQPLDLLLPLSARGVHAALVRGFAESGETARAMGARSAIRARRKDGTEFPAESAISHATVDGQRVFIAILRDVTARQRWQTLLQGMVEGTTGKTGESFLLSLVRSLGEALSARAALLVEVVPGAPERVRTHAFWSEDGLEIPPVFDIAGTPAELLLAGEEYVNLQGVRRRFPHDPLLARLGAECYCGIPLLGGDHQTVGILAVIGAEAPPRDLDVRAVLSIFGARAGSELERVQAETRLRDEHAKLEAIIEGTSDLVFVKDRDGRYVLANSATSRFLEVPAAALMGHADDELFPPNLAELIRESDERVMRTGQAEVMELSAPNHRVLLISRHLWRDAAGAVIGTIGVAKDITERKRTEELLRQTGEELRGILVSAPEAIFTCGLENEVQDWNPAAARLLGWNWSEVIGQRLPAVPVEAADEYTELYRQALAGLTLSGREGRMRTREGGLVDVLVSVGPLRNAAGGVRGTLWVVSDVSAQRDLERRLRQSQKLEAVGKLAGGIAHDFNNILTAITSFTELAIRQVDETDPILADLREIRDASRRAADLTQQLLAFSRRQMRQPLAIDLNVAIRDIERMLLRLIGEDITLVTNLAPDLGLVRADRSQIDQVLMNLVMNARDAMPGGGRLVIETDNVEMDDVYGDAGSIVITGPYVRLTITDTGQGMDPETCRRVFEPFFTTKSQGKGTGLGLAVVYGIVKQSDGYIWVYSEPGQGTSFKIYLPRLMAGQQAGAMPSLPVKAARGTETILLAEDDTAVREVTRRTLEEAGYTVLAAQDGLAALALAQSRSPEGRAELLIADVIMPGLTGPQLASRIQALWPGVRILHVSGYPEPALRYKEPLLQGAAYLQKPFTPEQLLSAVRDLLDTPPDATAAATPPLP